MQIGPELNKQDNCITCGIKVSTAKWNDGQDTVVTQWSEIKSMRSSTEVQNTMDLIISFFDSWLWEGRNEWMWSTTLPSLTLACCPNFVQNGAAQASSSCQVETSDAWALSHGAQRAPRKAWDYQEVESEPLPASSPYNHRTLISFRRAIKYLKATLNLMLDVVSTETTTFTHNTHKPHLYVYLYHHNIQFSSFPQPANSLCMTLHIQAVQCVSPSLSPHNCND